MKISPKPPLSKHEKEERKFLRNAQKWVDLGIIQQEGKSWKNVQYVTIFKILRLKIYPISRESYYGPSFKKQVLVIETIVDWWERLEKPEMTVYVTWQQEFYDHFNIKLMIK